MRQGLRIFTVAATLLGATLGVTASAYANTFTVDSTADDGDAGRDGVCKTINDECTLRAAIEEANANPSSSDLIETSLTAANTISLQSELPALSDVTIAGPDPSSGDSLSVVRVTGGNYRVFTVPSGTHVTISNLGFGNGLVSGLAPSGGGVLNSGTLDLNNVIVASNKVQTSATNASASATGAGIENSGQLDLSNVEVADNTVQSVVAASDGSMYSSTASGGGIHNSGSGQITGDAYVHSNQIAAQGAAASGSSVTATAEGGGIANADTGYVGLSGTISANTVQASAGGGGAAHAEGGGIHNGGAATLELSGPVTGNGAAGTVNTTDADTVAGGGLFNAGTLRLSAGSVSDNKASAARGSQSVTGGGIASTGSSEIHVSTIARNEVSNTAGAGTPAITAPNGGGGLYQGGAATLTGLTLAYNTASTATPTPSGGANLLATGTSTAIRDTIISSPQGNGGNCVGAVSSGGYNLEDDTVPSCQFTQATDLRGVDPQLVQTSDQLAYSPLGGSPAIDAGRSFGELADQMSHPRPVDIAASPNTACGDAADIGAIEVQGGTPGVAPDCTAPFTAIRRATINRKHRRATFRFSSNESGSAFRCRIDKKAYRSCTSPKTYRHLKTGRHRFRVYAVDAAGNPDRSPAVKKFSIRS